MELPVPAAYVMFALVPVSASSQPVGNVPDVPLSARVSKSWMYGASSAMRLTEPPACARVVGDVAVNAMSRADPSAANRRTDTWTVLIRDVG